VLLLALIDVKMLQFYTLRIFSIRHLSKVIATVHTISIPIPFFSLWLFLSQVPQCNDKIWNPILLCNRVGVLPEVRKVLDLLYCQGLLPVDAIIRIDGEV